MSQKILKFDFLSKFLGMARNENLLYIRKKLVESLVMIEDLDKIRHRLYFYTFNNNSIK